MRQLESMRCLTIELQVGIATADVSCAMGRL